MPRQRRAGRFFELGACALWNWRLEFGASRPECASRNTGNMRGHRPHHTCLNPACRSLSRCESRTRSLMTHVLPRVVALRLIELRGHRHHPILAGLLLPALATSETEGAGDWCLSNARRSCSPARCMWTTTVGSTLSPTSFLPTARPDHLVSVTAALPEFHQRAACPSRKDKPLQLDRWDGIPVTAPTVSDFAINHQFAGELSSYVPYVQRPE